MRFAQLAPSSLAVSPWRDLLRRPLALALATSLVLHGLFLTVHFGLPKALKLAREQALDVVLVNSKSARKPTQAQALAQANLDGGGNTDEKRRASTFLPPSPKTREGDDLAEAQRRVAALEQQQRLVLAQASKTPSVREQSQHSEQQPTPAPATGQDLANTALAIARLEAQISTNINQYNERPRKKFIGARTEEYRYAQYIEDWRQKIERVGNLNYPESARGHLYGSLVITVIIKSDGTLQSVEVNRPSQHKLLDDAARRIVRLAAPYAPFPPSISGETDILEITRTWSFTNADKMRAD